MHRRLVATAAIAVFVTVAAAACSVVDDGKVDRINPPGGLANTLPSTTSSTIPSGTSTTGLETSTSLVQTELVRLYFIASGKLTYVNQPLPSPVALPLIVYTLQHGPPVDTPGLRTAIPADALIAVTTDGSGIARVDLPDKFFDRIAVGEQRLVIAQLVLTLTDSRGIGQVVFDQPVTKPSGLFVAAGQPVSHLDYQVMAGVPGPPAAGETATTTTLPPP